MIGGGASGFPSHSGAGGAGYIKTVAYGEISSGTSISITIGAGGQRTASTGNDGPAYNGGATTVTIGGTTYTASGGTNSATVNMPGGNGSSGGGGAGNGGTAGKGGSGGSNGDTGATYGGGTGMGVAEFNSAVIPTGAFSAGAGGAAGSSSHSGGGGAGGVITDIVAYPTAENGGSSVSGKGGVGFGAGGGSGGYNGTYYYGGAGAPGMVYIYLQQKIKINDTVINSYINYSYTTPSPGVYTLDFTGAGYKTVKLQLYGAGGGHSKGGQGGYVEGIVDLSLISSKKCYVVVGGAGSTSNTATSGVLYTTGGINGGGRGVSNNSNGNDTGGGGGATDVRLVNVTAYTTAQRILVAGGGGGGTSNSYADANGGNAGYPTAPNVPDAGYGGADGGTQSSGGSLNGSFGLGGENANNTGWNGGGGGGYYGGGACKVQHGGGAGGSGYYDSSYITSFSYTSSGGGANANTSGYAVITLLSEVPPQITGNLNTTKSTIVAKYILNVSIPFNFFTTNNTDTGSYTRTFSSSVAGILTIPNSSTATATIIGPGRTTINATQSETLNFTSVSVSNIITIVIVGQNQPYTSDDMTSLDLSGTNLSGSVFTTCNLTGADLYNTTVNASTSFSTSTLNSLKSGRITGVTSLLPAGYIMI
jgi:hypothetical protein